MTSTNLSLREANRRLQRKIGIEGFGYQPNVNYASCLSLAFCVGRFKRSFRVPRAKAWVYFKVAPLEPWIMEVHAYEGNTFKGSMHSNNKWKLISFGVEFEHCKNREDVEVPTKYFFLQAALDPATFELVLKEFPYTKAFSKTLKEICKRCREHVPNVKEELGETVEGQDDVNSTDHTEHDAEATPTRLPTRSSLVPRHPYMLRSATKNAGYTRTVRAQVSQEAVEGSAIEAASSSRTPSRRSQIPAPAKSSQANSRKATHGSVSPMSKSSPIYASALPDTYLRAENLVEAIAYQQEILKTLQQHKPDVKAKQGANTKQGRASLARLDVRIGVSEGAVKVFEKQASEHGEKMRGLWGEASAGYSPLWPAPSDL
jgi:hypothetical protein